MIREFEGLGTQALGHWGAQVLEPPDSNKLITKFNALFSPFPFPKEEKILFSESAHDACSEYRLWQKNEKTTSRRRHDDVGTTSRRRRDDVATTSRRRRDDVATTSRRRRDVIATSFSHFFATDGTFESQGTRPSTLRKMTKVKLLTQECACPTNAQMMTCPHG